MSSHLFGSDVFTKRTLRLAWHLTTIAWIGIAVALWTIGNGSLRDAARSLSAMFFVSAAVTFVGSRGRHLAWVVFLAVAAAAWAGAPATARPSDSIVASQSDGTVKP